MFEEWLVGEMEREKGTEMKMEMENSWVRWGWVG